MRVCDTVRLLVIDQLQRVLLINIDDGISLHENRPDLLAYWVTPGGGLEANESFEDAAGRELCEETGLRIESLGPWVWSYERVLRFPDERLRLRERFYLASVAPGDINPTGLLSYEQQTHRALRWWSLPEMAQSDALFLPPDLPRLLGPLLDGDIPDAPIMLPAYTSHHG